MSKSLGQIAYEAYGDARGWKTFERYSMPEWDSQSDDLKVAWQTAAEAVAEALPLSPSAE